MRHSLLTRLTIAAGAFFASLTAALAAPTDQAIDETIARMQNWLLSQQDPATGRWDKSFPPEDATPHERAATNGETVMATYALLVSGWSPQEPRLDKALRYLRENDPWGTYGISVRAHIWASLPDDYLPNLNRDAEWLLKAQSGGLWNYGPVRGNRVDHSTSQYGILGLWEFSKRGGRTPDQVWQDAITHFLEYQNDEGGWAYSSRGDKPGEASGSMTAAGLTVLYIAIQQLYTSSDVPPPIVRSLASGHAWLDKHFTADYNPKPGAANNRGGHPWYYLYCLERVALASGVKTFGGKDWFEAGAEKILQAERKQGRVGNVVDTAFCLMFLSRGRVPVWINKIQLATGDWNNRPNDIYNFNAYLSDLRESEVNWQVVEVESDPALWLNAPVAWLSSDDKVELTEPQRANLKRYLDLGGVLVANSESGSAFQASIVEVARSMYPDLKFEAMPADHDALGMMTSTGAGAARNVRVLNNGVRDLIILLGQDWGRNLQTDKRRGESDAWKAMTNLYGIVSERGQLDNRLVHRIEPRTSRAAKGKITVARAKYAGAWDIEHEAWEPLKNVFFNRTGYDLEFADAEVDALDAAAAPLVHLAGVSAVELSDAQKQALKRYVESGGTVLVETVGGRGDFSLKVEGQLRGVFDADALPLTGSEAILTGQGLDNGHRISRALFRQYSVLNMAAKRDVRFSAIHHAGRPAVVFSHDDLSLGALGVKRWGINGYQSSTARELLTNLLLAAQKSQK